MKQKAQCRLFNEGHRLAKVASGESYFAREGGTVPPLGQVGLLGRLVCKGKSEKEKARIKHPLSKVDTPYEKKIFTTAAKSVMMKKIELVQS